MADIIEVFKALLDGGYIEWVISPEPGEDIFEAMAPDASREGYKHIGIIPWKPFIALYSNGIIEYSGETWIDKRKRLCSRFRLAGKYKN